MFYAVAVPDDDDSDNDFLSFNNFYLVCNIVLPSTTILIMSDCKFVEIT